MEVILNFKKNCKTDTQYLCIVYSESFAVNILSYFIIKERHFLGQYIHVRSKLHSSYPFTSRYFMVYFLRQRTFYYVTTVQLSVLENLILKSYFKKNLSSTFQVINYLHKVIYSIWVFPPLEVAVHVSHLVVMFL